MNIKTRIATKTMELQGRTIFKKGQVLILDKQSNGFWILINNSLGTGGFTSKEELDTWARKLTKKEKKKLFKKEKKQYLEYLKDVVNHKEEEMQNEIDDFFADEIAEIESLFDKYNEVKNDKYSLKELLKLNLQ